MDLILFLIVMAISAYAIHHQFKLLDEKHLGQEAHNQERQKFIRAHAHELGEDYAGKFWDMYN